jgi:endonuclease IV
MTVVYAIRNNTTVPDNDQVIREQLREEAERRFACHLILRTVREACEITDWYITGQYKSRYYYHFGFNQNADKERAFRRIAGRLKDWVTDENFASVCRNLGFDGEEIRATIEQILIFNQAARDKVQPFLEHIEQELDGRDAQKAKQAARRHRAG